MDEVKILLLDNDEEERNRTKNLLEKTPGFRVMESTSDGKKAVEIVSSQEVDLVVMDMILKNYDGFEVLERLDKLAKKPKILILSSLKSDGFAQKSLDLGASYYLVKPVFDEVVIKRINDILENKSVVSSRQNIVRNKSLEEKISNIFITVGIPAHIKGYQFLREAIKLAIDDPSIINSITGQLYPSIASRFDTSASKVERAIRHAIEVAWNRGKIENINNVFGLKIYSRNDKPTNGEFIALVADKMLVEGA